MPMRLITRTLFLLSILSLSLFIKSFEIREGVLRTPEDRFQNLEVKFKNSEFTYLLIYRFIGGVPWQLSCLLPTLFNVKISNFFFATFIGKIGRAHV